MKKIYTVIVAVINAAICLAQSGSPASTATISATVPGTANPWLAGMPNGTQSELGDYVPANAPALINVSSAAGSWIQVVNVTGTAAHWPPAPTGPEGCLDLSPCIFTNVSHEIGAEYGKSDLIAPINSLIGVFLDNNIPQAPAPGRLDFSMPASRDYVELHPLLKQVFFIGDGKTSTGVQQKVVIPSGATRLFLGIMDGIEWSNNTGAFNVTLNLFAAPQVRSCGNNKVLVCHKNKTLCIARSAVPAHLAHGDYMGNCAGSTPRKTKGSISNQSLLDEAGSRSFNVMNAPNPFRNSTRLQYEIPESGHVLITVNDVLGKRIATLVNSRHMPGSYNTAFNADALASGVYYYHVVYTTDWNGVFVKGGKLILAK